MIRWRKIMIKTILVTTMSLILLSGCVSKKSVSVIRATDGQLTCDQLTKEAYELQTLLVDYEDDGGLSGKNIGMAILFWPGIFVNESRAGDNVDSVRRRMDHLNTLLIQKCNNPS